jgi:exosortase
MTISIIINPAKAVTESIKPKAPGWKKSSKPHFYFWLLAAISCLAFYVPIRNLIAFSLSHDYGSHIFLIAPLSISFFYLKRHEVFSNLQVRSNHKTIIVGSSFLLLGLSIVLASKYQPFRADKLSLEVLSLVSLWASAFAFCYGRESLIKARFPLAFLLLLVPLPPFVIDKIIFALQAGSSDVAYILLRILNVPVLKDGFILRLPFVNLEVAKECSGIRSSIALLVTTLVAAELGLRSTWTKVILVMATIPILVLKNGIRIVTIYLLAAYLNPAFLHGWLHTSGGIVFYVLGLVAMIPVGVLLRKRESKPIQQSPICELSSVT